VNQAVPAEHHVNPGQRVAGQVEPHEPAIRAGLRVEASVAFDEFVDDVGTDIAARSQAGLAQPPEVAARDVENTAGRKLIEESWYLCSKRGRCIRAEPTPDTDPVLPQRFVRYIRANSSWSGSPHSSAARSRNRTSARTGGRPRTDALDIPGD
jgi:hypothetical protein